MHVRINKVETLSDDWYTLRKTTFDYRRRNGSWQTMSRETYDRGHGAVILLWRSVRCCWCASSASPPTTTAAATMAS
jgi:hypothetical protein